MRLFDKLFVRAKSKVRIAIPNDKLVILSRKKLVGESFSDRRLMGFSSEACQFLSCKFERMHIESASFGGGRSESLYEDCSFDGSEIYGSPGIARFERCTFRDVRIEGFFSLAGSFIDCVFSGDIRGSVFHGSLPDSIYGPRDNEFRGNDFREARLVDVDFRGGIDMSKQQMPVSWSIAQ